MATQEDGAVGGLVDAGGSELKTTGAVDVRGAIPSKFFDNPLDSFRNGVVMDMRLRLAVDLLTHSPIYHGAFTAHAGNFKDGDEFSPNTIDIALHALSIAQGLFHGAEDVGLLQALDDPDGAVRLEDHVKRQTAFQLFTSKEQQRQQEASLHVSRAVAGAFGRTN
jgi:hypothetical protein